MNSVDSDILVLLQNFRKDHWLLKECISAVAGIWSRNWKDAFVFHFAIQKFKD